MLKTWSDKGDLCRQSNLARSKTSLYFYVLTADLLMVNTVNPARTKRMPERSLGGRGGGKGPEVFGTLGAFSQTKQPPLPLIGWTNAGTWTGDALLFLSLSPHHPPQTLFLLLPLISTLNRVISLTHNFSFDYNYSKTAEKIQTHTDFLKEKSVTKLWARCIRGKKKIMSIRKKTGNETFASVLYKNLFIVPKIFFVLELTLLSTRSRKGYISNQKRCFSYTSKTKMLILNCLLNCQLKCIFSAFL